MKRELPIILMMVLFNSSFYCQVYVNQIGYPTNSIKIVVTKQYSPAFRIIDAVSGTQVYTGSFELTSNVDPLTGYTLYKGDFSDFNSLGKYFIITENGDTSHTFFINDTVYLSLYKSALKGFYFQRCGIALQSDYAGSYTHYVCHLNDGIYHPSTGIAGYNQSVGGWHDAGDFGKYVVNSGITVGTLLTAYELFPDKFYFDDLNIPESGNGIPDILDEVRYELNWLFTMQDTSDGGVYAKLTAKNFAGFIMPNLDNSLRYIYQKASTATGDFAAVMAIASRVFQPFDLGFSEKCLNAALNAWEFLRNNEGIVPPGGFTNPSDTNTGEYGDDNDTDERLWAAAELFKATNQYEFENYYQSNVNSIGIFNNVMNWSDVGTLANISILFNEKSASSILTSHINSLLGLADALVNKAKENQFNVTLSNGEFYWGSNGIVLNNAIILILAYEISKKAEYLNVIQRQMDYILGVNGHNLSFVTQTGSNSVNFPHHRQSGADNLALPVPGLLAGGPNQYLNDPVLQNLFDYSTPPALCYVDDQRSYASNEIAINWNAPLVFAAGYFNSATVDYVSGDNETENIPEGIILMANYPNPFNSQTEIIFLSSAAGTVEFTVYNLLGEKIYSKNILAGAGLNEFKFDTSGINNRMSSGVFFYTISNKQFKSSKKFVYLK